MKIKYKHTNIVARDWRALAQFYQDVLGCTILLPERDLSGVWLDKGVGVTQAHIQGAHLLLPGYGDTGPTLEIFQYDHNEPHPTTAANREGIGHLAFEVDSVEQVTQEIIEHGGSMIGAISSSEVEGMGTLTFVYLADLEGNIIELQSWE